ncbi:L,D-transpeptidase family protein [Nocardia brasiliensis]|uniref:L,D-transpeptidase family protein n=1 Tax=Nocardia brasiliensis TaxID=37326 RepID=A0A6G9Y1Z0_NOCBR|nr:L,D-transpeptidase family protein [Nocardia brasiliensis]
MAAAVLAAAGLALTATAQADPLWPGGPAWPGGPEVPAGPDLGTPPLIAPPPPAPVYAPCTAAKTRACMRLSTKEVWLMEDGKTVYGPQPIEIGRPGYESHVGVFDVDFKRRHFWSTMHNAPMEFAVFFDGDIATHIGPLDSMSHGCIRMNPDAAEQTYNHLEPGDIVEVVE